MYKLLSKNGTLVAFVVGLVLFVVSALMISSGLESFNGLEEEKRFSTGIFDFPLYASYALVAITAIIAILFAVYHAATNPKGAMKGILGIAALAILFFIAYSMAPTDAANSLEVSKLIRDQEINPGQDGFISASISSGVWIVGLGVIILIATEIWNFFK